MRRSSVGVDMNFDRLDVTCNSRSALRCAKPYADYANALNSSRKFYSLGIIDPSDAKISATF